MAAGHTHSDVLSRVRREQRMHGKPSAFSGLRIVLFAAGITVAIMLFVFGALGMLMLARSPQEPIASRLDPSAPLAQQNEVPAPAPQAELDPSTSIHEKKPEADTKTVKTLRVIAPAPQPAEQNDAVVQQQVPSSEPETTATIPAAPQAQQQPKEQPRQSQRPTRQQQAIRRPVPDSQNDNPLFQLFGIKKYR